MKSRMLLGLAAVLAIGACNDAPTTNSDAVRDPSFITNGELDGNRHPATVLIIMDVDGTPAFRCSGTLIAPKVVLTAGHCAGERGEFSGIRIFNEADVQSDPTYPFGGGPNTIEARSWKAHPLFTEAQFFLHDVGIIHLSKAVTLAANQYGHLPTVGQLDGLQVGGQTTFTAVGYGLQYINPVMITGVRVRMVAEPQLVQINSTLTGPFSMLLSNNANTGGTCFGDSGGPNYLGSSNVIAAVTSYARQADHCVGSGGVFRLDKQDVLDFINRELR
jgi:secreted trypsin-like serine protease